MFYSLLDKNRYLKLIRRFLSHSFLLNKILDLLEFRRYIDNLKDLLLILLKIKQRTDIFFKCGFKFSNFTIERWKYLKYYITSLKKGVALFNEGNDIFAKIGNLKIKLFDEVNGIYQIKEIFINRIYDKFEYKNKVVIDIGGFIGVSALYFLSKGASKVYIYEINDEFFKILKENIKINNLSEKVTSINKGVSNTYKEGFLNVTKIKGSSGCFQEVSEKMEILYKKKIDLIPIEVVLNEPIDILKIDCEGCEYDILEDFIHNNYREKINIGMVLEAHYIDKYKNPKYVKSLLKEIGFEEIIVSEKSKYWELIWAKE
jgi:FkbM family methyltransferase